MMVPGVQGLSVEMHLLYVTNLLGLCIAWPQAAKSSNIYGRFLAALHNAAIHV